MRDQWYWDDGWHVIPPEPIDNATAVRHLNCCCAIDGCEGCDRAVRLLWENGKD